MKIVKKMAITHLEYEEIIVVYAEELDVFFKEGVNF